MILITGATGTNGSEIVKQLVAAGARVRALVRNREKAALAFKGLDVELVEGDFARPETLDAALQGVEKALLLSAVHTHQVEWQGNFIEAAKRAAHAPHVVKFSAMGANPDSPIRLARWHGQTEKQLEQSGLPYTHLRPTSFMQNMLWSAQSIVMQGAFYMPMKDARASHVDVRDIAAVAVKVFTESGHEGKSYEITGPEALSYSEIAEKLSAVTGKKVTYVNVTPEDWKKGMMAAGMPEWYADVVTELYSALSGVRSAPVTNVVAEVAKKEPISFDQFARDYAHVFKGQ
jgi:uncharacterized protein YbjT (DUF2867 family)